MRYAVLGMGASLAAALFSVATAAWASSAAAVETTAATLSGSRYVWGDDPAAPGAPVRIVVNLTEQRAYVYRGAQLIAASSVSTGRDGKETPSGSFTILEKQVSHRSTLYHAAPMPYMERLTWDGVAIHAGSTPGSRSSHGCVHVPLAFAKLLYGVTSVGTQVTIIGTDGQVAPVAPTDAVPDDSADETAAANRAAMQVASR